MTRIKIIGGGLAGPEAALTAARLGAEVDLYEMRPVRMTPAHETADFGELVCSNSLKSESENTAPWLLKQEMRRAGSALLQQADLSAVPAGHALAVDRVEFSRRIAEAIDARVTTSLKVGAALRNPTRVFHVNWFRQSSTGSYLWPGYGDNLRVLAWILDRCAGRASAIEEPIGRLPTPGDINTAGLDISAATLAELNSVPRDAWRKELAEFRQYLLGFGPRLPAAMLDELDDVVRRLDS